MEESDIKNLSEDDTSSSDSENHEEDLREIPKLDLSNIPQAENYEEHVKQPKKDPEFVDMEEMITRKPRKKKKNKRKKKKRQVKRRLLSKKEAIDEYRKELPRKRSWERSSSSFRSDSKRMQYQRTQETPPPGKYNVDVSLGNPTYGLSSLKSGTPRFHNMEVREKLQVPSPNHYNVHEKPSRSKKLGFFPQSKRFEEKVNKSPSMTSYEPMESFININNTRYRIHSPFRSESKRFMKIKKRRTPVQYGRLSRSMEVTGGKFSQSQRFSTIHGRRFSTPPPGCYFSKVYGDFSKSRAHSFSQSRRFGVLKKHGPGPGEYLTSEIPESLHKKWK